MWYLYMPLVSIVSIECTHAGWSMSALGWLFKNNILLQCTAVFFLPADGNYGFLLMKCQSRVKYTSVCSGRSLFRGKEVSTVALQRQDLEVNP